MIRSYKEESPLTTINKIRNILSQLELLPIERKWYQPFNNLLSVRLECGNDGGDFGTNGKGRTLAYTLASAYAEFIERLQNGYILGVHGVNRCLLTTIKSEIGFYYFPDEKQICKTDFENLPQKYLRDLFNGQSPTDYNWAIDKYYRRLKSNGFDGVVSVPFYDVRKGRFKYLPYNLTVNMTSSNGMAAGNTLEECIYQGMCELMERYAVSNIYYKRLTPPTIPLNFLLGFPKETALIENIKRQGYNVEIRDFSCGEGIPAVGVLIIDLQKKRYHLNVGVDTCFNIALSRALTEILQGIENDKDFRSMMLPIPIKEHDYFMDDSIPSLNKRSLEIRKFIINGQGVFPASLFYPTPSYPFSESNFSPKESYRDEVKYICKFLMDKGFDIYIRDVSFLGFPSCYIYIPQFSIFGKKSIEDASNVKSISETVDIDSLEDLFFTNKDYWDKNTITQMMNIVSPERKNNFQNVKMQDILRLEFKSDCYWSFLPANFFLSLWAYAIGEYDNAIMYLKSFMSETKTKRDKYYSTILSYFTVVRDNQIKGRRLKTTNIPKEIVESFSSIKRMFSEIEIPTCPNCSSCPLRTNCLTKQKLVSAINIGKLMSQNYENSYYNNTILSLFAES